MKTILYSDDVNLLQHWESALANECSVILSLEELLEQKSSLIMLNTSACGHKSEEILTQLLAQNNKLFIMQRVPTLENLKSLLRISVSGYANALMDKELLSLAVQSVIAGSLWIHPDLISELILGVNQNKDLHEQKLEVLSEREKEVARLIAKAYTYKQMAEELNVTPRTIKAHAQSIYLKLEVKDRFALALYLKN